MVLRRKIRNNTVKTLEELPEDLTELTGEFITPDLLAVLLKKNGYRKTESEWFEHIVDAMYGYLVINSLPGEPMVEYVEGRELKKTRLRIFVL